MTIKQFSRKLREFELELGVRANIAMRDAAKQSVPVVKKELRDAETREGSYPLIASRRMYASTKWNRIPSSKRGRRVVANVGVFGYKIAASKRGKTAGKSRGSKIRSKSGAEGKGGARIRATPKLSKAGNREAIRMAYFVQQKIRRKGILPRFYMAKSMDKISKKVVTSLRRQGKKLKAKYPVKFTVRRLA
jgi:hypothetical protein